jgi:hypothetical protein
MTEQKNQLASLFAACWKDEALKARLMADPKAVLAEYDMDVPDGMDVKVVENADNCVHITMPAPPADHLTLSDEELSNAAGGSYCPGSCDYNNTQLPPPYVACSASPSSCS